MSGNVLRKSRINAVSLAGPGCFGWGAVQACQVSSEQISTPDPQMVEQVLDTDATSQVPCGWPFSHSCVPSPQLLWHDNRTGGCRQADHEPCVQVRMPSPQAVVQG